MSCRKKRDLPTCVVKGRRAPGKSLGTWVIMLSLLPQECSTSSRPDPWPPVPSLPPNPKTPLLSAPTPSYSLFSVISSSFTQLSKRSLQPGHPQPSGTPQALGTTQFLTQTLPVESWMKHLLLAWPCAESRSSLASFQPILQRPRVNRCLRNASALSADLPASVGVTALPSGSVCLPVGPGLGDRTMTANHRFKIWRKNWSPR